MVGCGVVGSVAWVSSPPDGASPPGDDDAGSAPPETSIFSRPRPDSVEAPTGRDTVRIDPPATPPGDPSPAAPPTPVSPPPTDASPPPTDASPPGGRTAGAREVPALPLFGPGPSTSATSATSAPKSPDPASAATRPVAGPGARPAAPRGRRRGRRGKAAHARKKRRRSWAQRGVIGVNVCVVALCLLAAGGLSFAQKKTSDITRIGLGGTLSSQGNTNEPQNFLLVGVDNDTGLANNDPVKVGREQTLNTDTIMILRVDPAVHKAWMLSFPRDLYVKIPGGYFGRINTALTLGGPPKLIETIQTDFGIPIHHYLQVNFYGFEQMVGAIGGVPIYLDKPVRDQQTGLFQYTAGCITLEGAQALAYVRSRHLEVQTGPYQWQEDPSSDWGRIRRQQEFMRAALKRAIDKGARNPFTLNQLIDVAQNNVQIDGSLTPQQIVDLGQEYRDFDPDTLEVYQPPTVGAWIGGAAVLQLQELAAQPIFDIFRGANPTLNLLKTVRVEVRNGTGRTGQGKEVADDLVEAGFTVPRWKDASTFRTERTTIRFAPSQKLFGVVLARFVNGPIAFEEDPSLNGDTGVALVIANDFGGIRKDPRPELDFRDQLTPERLAFLESQGPAASSTSTTNSTLPVTTSEVKAEVPKAPAAQQCGT